MAHDDHVNDVHSRNQGDGDDHLREHQTKPSRIAPQNSKASIAIETDWPCCESITATDLDIRALRVPDDYAPSTPTKIGKSPPLRWRRQTGSTACGLPNCAGAYSEQRRLRAYGLQS